MTLSEIENRIKEITKELDELQKKAEEYCRTHSNNSKIGYAGIVASTISFRTVFGAVAGLVCGRYEPDSEENEFYRIESKIYKLTEELNELDNKRFQIKINAIKDSNRIIDEEYLKTVPIHLGVKYISITYKTDNSVGIMCSDSKFFALSSKIGVSPDVRDGQSFYA